MFLRQTKQLTAQSVSRWRNVTIAATLLCIAVISGTAFHGAQALVGAAPARWDDFTTRANGRLDAAPNLPSGQKWSMVVAPPATAADLTITDGKLRLSKAGAAYMHTTGTGAAQAAIGFTFDPGTTTDSAVGLIMSKKPGPAATGAEGVATNSVHATFGVSWWSIGIFSPAGLSYIATGSYPTPLVADGTTRYSAALRRVGPSQIEVTTPDGAKRIVKDSRIDTWWGPTVLTELYQPTASFATDARAALVSYNVPAGDAGWVSPSTTDWLDIN